MILLTNLKMINEIPKDAQISPGPQHRYEVIVRDIENEKIIYRNIGYAGTCSIMEKVTEFGLNPAGIHQLFAFGNPILQFYCYDQLQKWFKTEGFPKTMAELKRLGFVSGDVDDLVNTIMGGKE